MEKGERNLVKEKSNEGHIVPTNACVPMRRGGIHVHGAKLNQMEGGGVPWSGTMIGERIGKGEQLPVKRLWEPL